VLDNEDSTPLSDQIVAFTDKYGVSWQVVPTVLLEMLKDPDSEKSQRVMEAMLQMKKLDIEKLKRAYAG
jgi:predicted 3-demethylubiquinone-9 3-methyltransferase (glyoxalase superfamily)